MDEKTCRRCVNWKPKGGKRDVAYSGVCESDKIVNALFEDLEDDGAKIVAGAGAEEIDFVTGPGFGCVNFEVAK